MSLRLFDEGPSRIHQLPRVSVTSTDWQANAKAVYQRTEQDEIAALSAELISRIFTLTGRLVSVQRIVVERDRRRAVVAVDGVRFQLQHHELAVIRSCAYCGTGEFVSPVVESVADLGYTLGVWEPRHPDCYPEDPLD